LSETPKCRERLTKYCLGYGVDIGYGGDTIVPSAISVDLPVPYTHVGDHPLNLGGDAKFLYWFESNVLDYVFSSHLLEDFEDTENVLKEWIRVIKPGGYLVIFCPDEQIYREHCRKTGQSYNNAHKIQNFSLSYVKSILINKIGNIDVIHENPLIDEYSFEIVIRKRLPSLTSSELEIQKLRQNIQSIEEELKDRESTLKLKESILKDIYESTGWALLQYFNNLKRKTFPENTRRYKLWILIDKGIAVWAKEGFWNLIRKVFKKLTG
jgi:ubiquinone/menaquinone biosynthesis C-methylase UbiE